MISVSRGIMEYKLCSPGLGGGAVIHSPFEYVVNCYKCV